MTTMQAVLDSKGRKVHSTEPDTTVYDALKRMAELNVGALVVLDGLKLVGILSERDYARKVVLQGRSSLDTPVRDIMTTSVVCVEPDRSVHHGMELMTRHAVRHLPVVDEDGDVIGIVSIGDLVKSIIRHQEFVIDQLEHYIHG